MRLCRSIFFVNGAAMGKRKGKESVAERGGKGEAGTWCHMTHSPLAWHETSQCANPSFHRARALA